MRVLNASALVALLACWSSVAHAQQAAVPQLTLEQCVEIALAKNPMIQSAIERHRASRARVQQATAIPYPSLDFNSDLQPHPLNFVQSDESYIGISQTLELPRKRATRGKIAGQESEEIATEIETTRLDVAFRVRQSFYRILLAQEQLNYARLDLELAEDFRRKAEFKHAAGDVAQVEALRAKVEALKAANAVRVATNGVRLAKAVLNFHLARDEAMPLEITGNLQMPFMEIDLKILQQEARALRPELQIFRHSVQKQALIQEAARQSNWPDPDLNFSHHRITGEPRSWSFTISLPLPFFFRQRQKAEIAEAGANISALERERQLMDYAILLEVEEAFTNAQTARGQILLYRDQILPQAQEVYDMFLFSYQEGEIGGIELIEARRTLNESRRALAEALYEHAATLAALDRAVGRTP
ncbi:MAG: TolC family protein [Acidobacteria bacterium]|nr:TolC family protein [Acidobacteriota bacterium]